MTNVFYAEEKRMKLRACWLTLSVIAIASLTLAQNAKEPTATKAAVAAFVNVNVIPMDRERVIENRFIVDGSLFVTSAGVNPTATIGALALRVAEGIWERRREWQ
jgi:hypothetical protein